VLVVVLEQLCAVVRCLLLILAYAAVRIRNPSAVAVRRCFYRRDTMLA